MSNSCTISYFILGVPVGVGMASLLDELDVPRDTRDAVAVISGLLWPLVFVALTAFGVYLGIAALWRHGHGPRIPRAVVRESIDARQGRQRERQ